MIGQRFNCVMLIPPESLFISENLVFLGLRQRANQQSGRDRDNNKDTLIIIAQKERRSSLCAREMILLDVNHNQKIISQNCFCPDKRKLLVLTAASLLKYSISLFAVFVFQCRSDHIWIIFYE